MLEKIAAADIDQMLLKSASTIRAQGQRIRELEIEKAARDREDHAEKIAHAAVERGIMGEDEAEDYAEKLASGTQDLSMVEDFVGRASAGGVHLGQTLEKTASEEDGGSGGGGQDVLTTLLLNSEFSG